MAPDRLLVGVGDPQDVAQAVLKVLTASLRQVAGFPLRLPGWPAANAA